MHLPLALVDAPAHLWVAPSCFAHYRLVCSSKRMTGTLSCCTTNRSCPHAGIPDQMLWIATAETLGPSSSSGHLSWRSWDHLLRSVFLVVSVAWCVGQRSPYFRPCPMPVQGLDFWSREAGTGYVGLEGPWEGPIRMRLEVLSSNLRSLSLVDVSWPEYLVPSPCSFAYSGRSDAPRRFPPFRERNAPSFWRTGNRKSWRWNWLEKIHWSAICNAEQIET